MSKRKRNRDRQPDDDGGMREIRIPLGMIQAEALSGLGMGVGPERLPTEADAARATEVSGFWHRIAAGATCDHGHRDGMMICVPSVAKMADQEVLRSRIGIKGVDGCMGAATVMIFDREDIRDLVNKLSEAVAESERREALARRG